MHNSKEYTRYKYVIENLRDVIWEMDAQFIFTFVSASAREISGYESKELVGHNMLDFLTEDSRTDVIRQWEIRMNHPENIRKVILYDVEFICRNGKTIWVEVSVKPIVVDNQLIRYIGVTRDISEKKAYENELKKYIEELKIANKKLDELATFDVLTGAYNRRKFEHYVGISIEHREAFHCPFSIIMYDIDFFKRINDNYGHKTGDRILQQLTAVVKSLLSNEDKIFRWGGEEFIILLPERSLEAASEVAENLRKAIAQNDFQIESDSITVSMGVGEYCSGNNIDQLVSHVDDALLKAKSNGRNRVEVSEEYRSKVE